VTSPRAPYQYQPEYDLAKMSDPEASFVFYWRLVAAPEGYPWPTSEYRFLEERKWKFDFAFLPPIWLAVECEGGIFTGGAHGSVSGILRDIEKYNAATLAGWRVFRATTLMLNEENAEATIRQIMRAIDIVQYRVEA